MDEMLAIRAEIESWKAKKESIEANGRYNEILNEGLLNYDAEDEIC
ncbi:MULTISPECIES: hypothetical protein [Eubacterium]|nr:MULTISPECIES: hypothetical protein [Eubacterium]MCR5368621.1 hypothetical protein [Eubacterium sp.]